MKDVQVFLGFLGYYSALQHSLLKRYVKFKKRLGKGTIDETGRFLEQFCRETLDYAGVTYARKEKITGWDVFIVPPRRAVETILHAQLDVETYITRHPWTRLYLMGEAKDRAYFRSKENLNELMAFNTKADFCAHDKSRKVFMRHQRLNIINVKFFISTCNLPRQFVSWTHSSGVSVISPDCTPVYASNLNKVSKLFFLALANFNSLSKQSNFLTPVELVIKTFNDHVARSNSMIKLLSSIRTGDRYQYLNNEPAKSTLDFIFSHLMNRAMNCVGVGIEVARAIRDLLQEHQEKR